ncbi:MAG: hypothetical protein IJ191_00410 [Treponema sp.]|nr:hypothetical protein [Treponema sp.]
MAEAQIQKFGKNILIPYYMIIGLPLVVYTLFLLFIGEFSGKEILLIWQSPLVVIIATLFLVVVPTFIWKYCERHICAYDSTSEESLFRANRAVKLMERLIFFHVFDLGIPMIGLPIFVLQGVRSVNFRVLIYATYGIILLFSIIPYIVFMQALEHHVKRLELRMKLITTGFIGRNIIVSLFSVIGTVFCILAPVYVDGLEGAAMVYRLILCAGLGINVSVITTVMLQVAVRNRIKTLVTYVNNLKKYDYTQNALEIRGRDELGILGRDLNIFTENTKDLINTISSSADTSQAVGKQLSESAGEVSSSITEISASINQIRARVGQQAGSVEEVEALVFGMTDQIKKLNASVGESKSAISESSSAVEEMVASIRSVTETLNQNARTVEQLTQASDEGRSRVEQSVEQTRIIMEESAGLLEASAIIQNIAEQTNLLAMNAAIEAAHAGEAGKGFAVVADEIRKLAEQSNTQGKAITGQLEKLQTSIANISDGTKHVQEQFSIIYNFAGKVQDQEKVVVNAMHEQSAGSNLVLDAIKVMQKSIDVLSAGSSEVMAGADQVAEKMKVVSNVAEEVNGAVTEMQIGAQTIVDSVSTVVDATVENDKTIQNLRSEVQKFKLV